MTGTFKGWVVPKIYLVEALQRVVLNVSCPQGFEGLDAAQAVARHRELTRDADSAANAAGDYHHEMGSYEGDYYAELAYGAAYPYEIRKAVPEWVLHLCQRSENPAQAIGQNLRVITERWSYSSRCERSDCFYSWKDSTFYFVDPTGFPKAVREAYQQVCPPIWLQIEWIRRPEDVLPTSVSGELYVYVKARSGYSATPNFLVSRAGAREFAKGETGDFLSVDKTQSIWEWFPRFYARCVPADLLASAQSVMEDALFEVG